MIRCLGPLAVVLFLTGTASAQTPTDARIRELEYRPGEVYSIHGAYRTATQIVFSPAETIRHAAIGDSIAWEIAAEGSVLFLKPRERHPSTNLLVVTERNGEIRHYAFELVAADRNATAVTAYQVRFRYPLDEREAAARTLADQAKTAEATLIGLQLQQGAVEGSRNLAWTAEGDPDLQPSEVSDNGRFTILRFPGAQPIPALFEVSENGSESLIPYDVRGEFVVIHAAPRGLRLRRGASVLCLFNDAFDPRGANTGTATASPVIERTRMGGGR